MTKSDWQAVADWWRIRAADHAQKGRRSWWKIALSRANLCQRFADETPE